MTPAPWWVDHIGTAATMSDLYARQLSQPQLTSVLTEARRLVVHLEREQGRRNGAVR